MATQISRKTAELMAKKLRAKLDALYADQESHPSKQGSNNQRYPDGGRVPFGTGLRNYLLPTPSYGRVDPNGQPFYNQPAQYNPADPSTYMMGDRISDIQNMRDSWNPNSDMPTGPGPEMGRRIGDLMTMREQWNPGPTVAPNGYMRGQNQGPRNPGDAAYPNAVGTYTGGYEYGPESSIGLVPGKQSMQPSGYDSTPSRNSLLNTKKTSVTGGTPKQSSASWDTPEAKSQHISDQLEAEGGIYNSTMGMRGEQDPTMSSFTGYAGSNAPGLGGLSQGLNLKSGVAGIGSNGQSEYGSGRETGRSNTDWAGIAGAVGSFAPGLYNLYNAFQKPEVENPKDYYNPQYNNAMSLMRNRRFDVRPLLEQNQMNQNTYNRNIRNTASSRGELLSNMGGGYANRLRSDSAAYTQKSQMDAGYRGEEAQMRAQLGQQRAQTNMQVGDWNARNRAAQRNYGAAAAGNIGDASSLLLRNRNMKSADAMRTEAMTAAFPYLKEWMPGLEEMMKKYNTKG